MPSALMMEKKSPALDFDCRNCEMAMAPFFQSKYQTTFIHGIGNIAHFQNEAKRTSIITRHPCIFRSILKTNTGAA